MKIIAARRNDRRRASRAEITLPNELQTFYDIALQHTGKLRVNKAFGACSSHTKIIVASLIFKIAANVSNSVYCYFKKTF